MAVPDAPALLRAGSNRATFPSPEDVGRPVEGPMTYFRERDQGELRREQEEIRDGPWGGILALIRARIEVGSFAASNPVACEDGRGPTHSDPEERRARACPSHSRRVSHNTEAKSLLAARSRNICAGASPDAMYSQLGSWSWESHCLMGVIRPQNIIRKRSQYFPSLARGSSDLPDQGIAASGVQERNGFFRPWAADPKPGVQLSESRLLRETVF